MLCLRRNRSPAPDLEGDGRQLPEQRGFGVPRRTKMFLPLLRFRSYIHEQKHYFVRQTENTLLDFLQS